MKFTMRHVVAAFTTACVVLAIVRRPIAFLFQDGGSEFLFGFFLPFLHLGWLLGFDVQYPTYPSQGRWMDFGVIVGFFMSSCLHMAIIWSLCKGFVYLWKWAND